MIASRRSAAGNLLKLVVVEDPKLLRIESQLLDFLVGHTECLQDRGVDEDRISPTYARVCTGTVAEAQVTVNTFQPAS